MPRVFPTILPPLKLSRSSDAAILDPPHADLEVFTVWKKSLLLNCTGFTVFDAAGNLVYRVDTYAAGNKGHILLMDADGKPILTMRRKRLTLGESWMVYDGEEKSDPIFSVFRPLTFRRSNTLAHVRSSKTTPSQASSPSLNNTVCKIQGSYRKRSVSVYDAERRCLAEIRRKEAVGGVALGIDVFKLIVARSHLDTAPAMALVVLLDQMFGSLPSSPARCISC